MNEVPQHRVRATLRDLLAHLDSGATLEAGSPLHEVLHDTAQHALRVTAELNAGYREPDEVRALLGELTGREIDPTVTVFPPFHCEFGRNLRLGARVFVNMGCRFQDTGGITIGEATLIGHGTTLTTLNHAEDPARRGDMIPRPVTVGRRVWIGASVTVVPGVTIGDGAIVGAGAVVTRDVPADTIVAGVRSTIVTHGIDWRDSSQKTHPVVIGDYVLVGSNAVVCPGAVIADRCVVGMGTVVGKGDPAPGALIASPRGTAIKQSLSGDFFVRQDGYVH